ncbi:MAG: molybdopterin-guanine dinucleotide biosynthesis protein MobB [Dehalococcoidia bacterium]
MGASATVVCVRGPSGSGKTLIAGHLAAALTARGLHVGYVKRSHHPLDTPGKDSDRLAGAGATVVLTGAGGQALFRTDDDRLDTLLGLFPATVEVILVETFRPERFPTILTAAAEPAAGETALARLGEGPAPAAATMDTLADLVAAVHHARATAAGPAPERRPHRCAGAVLGRRLARLAATMLELDLPRTDRRLFVLCENDGCAADALAAATGCHPGNRTLRFTYDGKMAATFVDMETGRAIRVSARADCRETARQLYPDVDQHLAQQLAYDALPDERLFTFRWTELPTLPGPRRGHLLCATCGEEVDGDAAVRRDELDYCRPCASRMPADGGARRGGMPWMRRP